MTTPLTQDLINEMNYIMLDSYSSDDYFSWSYDEMRNIIKKLLDDGEDNLSDEDFEKLYEILDDSFADRDFDEDEKIRQSVYEYNHMTSLVSSYYTSSYQGYE